ncbi:MAG TPA: type II toxin-antitoxin system VapC family toxin [Candidatus Bathyarchaeia archaeon]
MLADTSFIIDLMAGDDAAVEKAEEIEAKDIPLIVSAPTVFELYVGLSLSRKPDEEKSRIFAVLQSLPFLPLDYMSSQAGGRIYGDKRRSGSMIDPEDAMIAGIARVHGKKLLTRNLKHFQGIEGVNVEPY